MLFDPGSQDEGVKGVEFQLSEMGFSHTFYIVFSYVCCFIHKSEIDIRQINLSTAGETSHSSRQVFILQSQHVTVHKI